MAARLCGETGWCGGAGQQSKVVRRSVASRGGAARQVGAASGAVQGGKARWGSAERCGGVGQGSAARGKGRGEGIMQHNEVTVRGGDNVRGQFEGTRHSEVSSEAR